VTRLSSYLLPTEKEAPADAEAVSNRLMVRAGLIRQIGAGLWTWMPAGWRVHQRVVAIIREEMNAAGGHEMLMPVLQPAEVWRRTGRYAIDELFKLKDRKGADLVLALTHEEAVTTHVAQVVRSYRELPLVLYHFQVKERDEARPRAGVLRTREFIMKDAYSFDRDLAGLEERYEQLAGAYDRVFDRCGLQWYRVSADVGMMGGLGADEYMAPCAAGENEVALAAGGYAANVEVASAWAPPVALDAPRPEPVVEATPGLTTVEAVAASLGLAPGALLKAYPVVLPAGAPGPGGRGAEPVAQERMVLVLLRGDHRVNEIKLASALGTPSRQASAAEISAQLGPPGFIGPVGLDGRVEIVLDAAVQDGPSASYVTGARRADHHLRGVEPGRDFPFRRADVRNVQAGDRVGGPDGAAIEIVRAIEVGNIFKLGTRYSEPLGARFLDEQGREQSIVMGSYGIGPARIAAAAVEQYADESGICWPRAIAPWDVHIVALGPKKGLPEEVVEVAEGLYRDLAAEGLSVVLDDRTSAGTGEKFADAELLGCPLRLTIGPRSIESGAIEVQHRRGRETGDPLPLHGEGSLAARVAARWRELP
jgi:prolyl-tRNA synthetase